MLSIQRETALPGLEQKAFADLQEKMLQAADDGAFQVALTVTVALFQA